MSSTTHAPRVVIDTNLVLSALVFAQSRLTPLRQAWKSQQILPLLSKITVAELIRVLNYPKFKLSTSDQQELLADYLPYCQTIVIPEPPPVTPECRDAFDLPFLQLAIAGQAEALITGDQDLLTISEPFICPILTAEQFLPSLNA
ncbi:MULTISPECIES: putative toxin-antitoxin system toxin component, PIN family [Methylomonas]|uniref:Twitching motility protein PilT n=1 Tax=Methylomonas koyamae TaxID=702114 RepID=A0A177NUH1_9GAMM|nr:putative toxin-antitoxin system toxin component, PIN family [Methylomonas koyamae]OAI20730.1 twitching motility protein PilT [Methylomonas koyamae]